MTSPEHDIMVGMESNILSEEGSKRNQKPACVFVLFGATGDLAARKIAPALYNLPADGLLGEEFAVLGVARRPKSDEQFREEMLEAISKHSRQKLDDEALADVLAAVALLPDSRPATRTATAASARGSASWTASTDLRATGCSTWP